jgi:NAD(P)-dependent dehydrogenase (short-subunit alcohol dehydrogenase family)
MDLSGRTALVTGAAGHIGSALAEALLELGASVVLQDRDPALCQTTAEAFRARGLECVDWVAADLADEMQTRGIVRSVCQRHGRLDVLIHCAAFVGTTDFPGWAESMESQTVAAWDAAMRVNVTAAFVLIQEAADALKVSGKGAVVLVSSIYGMNAPDLRLYEGTSMQNPAAYGVSKAGLLQLARYFATVLAPSVRVNALTAGGVWRNQPEVFIERYVARTPLGRMALEEDLKGAVAFLASDQSAYVTGTNLVVDGGWTAW